MNHVDFTWQMRDKMLDGLLQIRARWTERLQSVLMNRELYWLYRVDRRSKAWKDYVAARDHLAAALKKYDEAHDGLVAAQKR